MKLWSFSSIPTKKEIDSIEELIAFVKDLLHEDYFLG